MHEQTTLKTEKRPSGVIVVRIHGDLDSMGTHKVGKDFEAALGDEAASAVVDLSQVNFISSAGMAMLLVKGKALSQAGGKLVIAATTTRVMEVLSLAGFHELFEVYPTLDEALVALES